MNGRGNQPAITLARGEAAGAMHPGIRWGWIREHAAVRSNSYECGRREVGALRRRPDHALWVFSMSETLPQPVRSRLAFSGDVPPAERLAVCKTFLKDEMAALRARHEEGASG